MIALAALTGEHHVLEAGELDVLRSIPADSWSAPDGCDPPALDSLTRKALLISDAADPELAAVRQRDEALSASEWNLYATLYHYMTQWTSLDIRDTGEDESQLATRSVAAAEEFGSEHGPAPPPFAPARSGKSLRLPGTTRDGPLYRTLTARRTTRVFDPSAPMTLRTARHRAAVRVRLPWLRSHRGRRRLHQADQPVGRRAAPDRGVSDRLQRRRSAPRDLPLQRGRPLAGAAVPRWTPTRRANLPPVSCAVRATSARPRSRSC